MPIPQPRIVLVRGKAKRWKLFSWAFVIVKECSKGQFLPAAPGRTKAVMVVTKMVMVVGCFAVSTAPFLLKFQQNIPGPPYGYGSIEYRGKVAFVRLSSDCQNDGNSDDGGKKKMGSHWYAHVWAC